MAYLEKFSFCVVSRLRGIIVAPHIMVQSTNFSPKSYYLCITNNEIVQNSKSKPKKFSFLCTFNASTALPRPLFDILRISTITRLSLQQSQSLYWHSQDLYKHIYGLYQPSHHGLYHPLQTIRIPHNFYTLLRVI